jgi:hypothetical protein
MFDCECRQRVLFASSTYFTRILFIKASCLHKIRISSLAFERLFSRYGIFNTMLKIPEAEPWNKLISYEFH